MKNTKEDYLNYRIDRAKETLGDALLLYENDRWNACINRLYYACFYIVSALLLSKDIEAYTHNGIKTRFFLEFIKTKIVDQEFGELYSKLMSYRQESDYADFIDFDKQQTHKLLLETKTFIHLIEKLV